MARSSVDRDQLFGWLAVQTGLIDEGQLAAATRACTGDAGHSLADHLAGRTGLDADARAAVETLVSWHLAKHAGGTEEILATPVAGPAAGPPAGETAVAADDPGMEATFAHAGPDEGGAAAVGAANAGRQRFRVLRPHARGGLGSVSVAMDEELHREVALKQILEQHADNPVSRARFLLEAEITGGLEHPGIVPVYGMGTDAQGRPYYAMRFIEGDTLKEAIDRFHADGAMKEDPGLRALELRKRLRRFTDVCNAIDYAHSRGVLHRDIKPANVIVGRHGETLVVDWGLAKAIGQADPGVEPGERLLVPLRGGGGAETMPGSSMGTPAFMSPEQAEGDIGRLGPRSDVYSLGATLYYLLTGRPPIEGDLVELLRKARRGEFVSPRRLDPSIDPALEAVCLAAMAHRPEDRYPTARALAEDVERWMADEPVSAWREPFARRARRWARRNRTAVLMGTVALVAGVIGLSAVLLVQTQAKADIARALENETRASRSLAAANEDLGRSKAAVQARYELAMDAIRTFHTGVSEDFLLKEEKFKALRDRLLKSASDFYGKLGALLGRETDAASRRALAAANFELAGLMAMVGRNSDALAAHRSVLAARRALAAEPGAGAGASAEVGRSLTEIAGLLESAGKTDEALAAYREAEGVLSGPAQDSTEARAALAACRSRMGFFLTTIGRNEPALAAYRLARADQEALAAAPGAPPETRRDLADTINRIGRLLANTGRPKEAEVEYRAAMAIRRELAAADPAVAEYRNGLAASHNNLGILLWQSGRMKDAEAEYRTALAIRQELADEDPAVAEFRRQVQASHFNLGNLLRLLGRLDESESAFRAALPIQRKLAEENPGLPEFGRLLALIHHHLGLTLKLQGRIKEAEAEYRTALASLEALVAANPAVTPIRSDLGSLQSEFGVLLAESGRPAEAEVQFRRSLANDRGLVAANPAVTEFRDRLATGHVNLGDLLSETGRPSEAEPEYARAQAIFRELAEANRAVGRFRFGLGYTHNRRGLLLAQTGRPSEAEAEDRRAVAIFRELADYNPRVPDFGDGLATALTNLADVVRNAGRPAEARDASDRAVALRERLVKENPKAAAYLGNLAASLRRRGLARRDLGDRAGASADIRRAAAILDGLASRSGEQWFETACCHAAMAGPGTSAARDPAEADRAMEILRRVVAMGYRNLDAFRAETALDPLRDRLDFRLLMMDLAMPADPFAVRD